MGNFLTCSLGLFDSGQLRARSQRWFFVVVFFFFSLHETLFPGIFESILTQLLQGNLKVSFPLCMKKAHIYVL